MLQNYPFPNYLDTPTHTHTHTHTQNGDNKHATGVMFLW